MTDVCALILEQHHDIRRRFADIDEYFARPHASADGLAAAWSDLCCLLQAHAEAEEVVLYPLMRKTGALSDRESRQAIEDHATVCEVLRVLQTCAIGSERWWHHVLGARDANSGHMAEEERGALSDLRVTAARGDRDEAGIRWQAFMDTRLRRPAGDHDDNNENMARHR